jgi:hypothetical protein
MQLRLTRACGIARQVQCTQMSVPHLVQQLLVKVDTNKQMQW